MSAERVAAVLAEIERRVGLGEAASPGRWWSTFAPERIGSNEGDWIIDSEATFICSTQISTERGEVDADFIAVNDPTYVLAVLRQHKAVLERHTRECHYCMKPDCECRANHSDWTPEEIAEKSEEYGRDVLLPAYDCTYCIESMQYEEMRAYPCPDVQGVLDCYPDTP